jgi:hypothetical protein
MARILHLGDRKGPPAGQRYFLVECVTGLARTELIKRSDGETIRISPNDYATEIAAIEARFSQSPEIVIYVRGAPKAIN